MLKIRNLVKGIWIEGNVIFKDCKSNNKENFYKVGYGMNIIFIKVLLVFLSVLIF